MLVHRFIVLVAFIVGARQIVTGENVTRAIVGRVIIAGATVAEISVPNGEHLSPEQLSRK